MSSLAYGNNLDVKSGRVPRAELSLSSCLPRQYYTSEIRCWAEMDFPSTVIYYKSNVATLIRNLLDFKIILIEDI